MKVLACLGVVLGVLVLSGGPASAWVEKALCTERKPDVTAALGPSTSAVEAACEHLATMPEPWYSWVLEKADTFFDLDPVERETLAKAEASCRVHRPTTVVQRYESGDPVLRAAIIFAVRVAGVRALLGQDDLPDEIRQLYAEDEKLNIRGRRLSQKGVSLCVAWKFARDMFERGAQSGLVVTTGAGPVE